MTEDKLAEEYQCSKLSMSKIDLILTELSEESEKIQKNNDLVNENANLGYFWLFLACRWPVMTPASVS